MQRRHLILSGLAALLAASPAFAAGYEDQIVDQLRGQGYRKIRVERTLLGRVRILATGNGERREIILNPRTGEILRDLWTSESSGSGSSGGRLVDTRDGGRRNDDDDDRDDDKDDDRDDDRDDDDHSGSGGGGNSGSGGGDDDDDD